jgi:hypothetical protein
MRHQTLRFIRPLVLGTAAISAVPAGTASNPALGRQFTKIVRPFVTEYCTACHSGRTPAAQFDLTAYSSVETVVRDYPRWTLVDDKLTAQEMPPKQMPQPPALVRRQVIDWIEAVRTEEARKNASDPGLVLLRRLSNAEYNYTIRDLTGVDMRPTREFPVDPANPGGFDNSGESLAMSPALLKKYLQAAHQVADQMVLTPDGIDFSPHPMLVETDRERYAIERIVNFYFHQPTDYADYFQAAWRFRYRAALGKPGATLDNIAADAKISAKYLPMVWRILQESQEAVGPIAKLQAMWRVLPAPGAHDPDLVRAKCVEMRNFVVRIRKHTAMQFASPAVPGILATSQPLMNWKLRAFASHRRDFDRHTLRNEDDPPPVVPPVPGFPKLDEEAAPRAAALALRARAGDLDLVVPRGQRARYEAAFAKFSSVFPDAFYISERGRYYPDDSEDKGRLLSAGFHNVMGYFRDDTPLVELILDEKGKKELARLWDEFDFITDYTRRTWIQYVLNQSYEVLGVGHESDIVGPSDEGISDARVIFAVRDAYLAKIGPNGNPVALQSARDHFARVNATIRTVEGMRVEAEPKLLDALLRFAERAYRRPLSNAEREDLLAYYHTLRKKNELSHEDAVRACIASVLISPDFLYRVDLLDSDALSDHAKVQTVALNSSSTAAIRPLSGYALASRLSYFLWSSMPDQELLRHAALHDLQKPNVLLAQVHRMLKDERARGMATEFGGNWLDFRSFETHNAVDRMRFPNFDNQLREAMFQEPIHFIENLIQDDRSVLDLLYADYTFVNPVLAKFYGVPEVKGDADTWVRVDDASRYQRGGLLPMAVFLTKSSPGLRTSPVKRGYWVVHRVLGETIPPPPPVVPELPADEAKSNLSMREMLAKHRQNPVCASCHARFDVFGLPFEGYGPVGEARTKDLAGRPVDTSAVLPGGVEAAGFQSLQTYIRDHRQKDFVDSLSRKLLIYALNRSLQLSDELLVNRMKTRLAAKDYRFSSLVETIVTSPQFLNKRISDLREKPELQAKKGD